MADRVVLHVGLPKTGTTSLQQTLRRNEATLAGAGVHLVVGSMVELYDAARDLTHGGRGAWRSLVDAVAAVDGVAVLSCEGLSAVPAHRAAAGLGDLAGAAHGGVRVVCTLRDPARVLVSAWQQHVRTGSSVRLDEFAAHATDGLALAWLPDPTEVLDAWSAGLDPAAVAVVTVPPTGAPADLLWRRFAAACGLDPDLAVDHPAGRANASLPATAVELLRRVNGALGDRRPPDEARYRELVRPLVRSAATGSPTRPGPEALAWAAGVVRQVVDQVRGRPYAVHGDLDDLLPVEVPVEVSVDAPAGADGADADLADADLVDAASAAVADLLLALRAARRPAVPERGRAVRRTRRRGAGSG